MKKIDSKLVPNPKIVIHSNDESISNPTEVTETLGSYFANISSDNNYTREFKQYKNTREATPIPFNTPNNLSLNEPFKLDEFNNILQPSKNSTPGEDTIPYELYKRLPNTEKQKLVDFLNFLQCPY